MALSLKEICERALEEIGSFNVPTTIVDNDDDTAKQCLAFARKVGEELVRDYDWQELSKTATVTTTQGVSAYDLESDYERLAPDTMWNADDFRFMRGHTSKRQWAMITNSQVDPGLTYYWRLKGGQIQLEPAAESAFDFTYEYLSNIYCKSSGGTDREDGWVADTDVPKLPSDLFIYGIRFYFLKANNLPYGDAEAEYDGIIQSRQGKNVPSPAVDMSAGTLPPRMSSQHRFNLPDRVDN